jgi:hypothetical protein
MNKVKQLLDIMLEYDIEIVTYGLAPNPNGFCFECGDLDTEGDSVLAYCLPDEYLNK